ncbi:MAG: MFS transporter [Chloroflexi bacterium]|nr:MFS transporter [Chloroflexota bacterium]
MPGASVKTYGYRWVVLFAFMLINVTIQILWICFAPITSEAAKFYGVTDLEIGLLAMVFMIIYIPFAFPASWAIDRFGFAKAVGFGAILLGVFAILRGVFIRSFGLTMVSTIGLAIAQPFLLNANTKVAAKWFALEERATAVALGLVASFLGIVLGQMLTPTLILSLGFEQTHLWYGVITAASAAIFLVLVRENPPTPASPPEFEARALMLDGLRSILRTRDFYFLAYVLFVGGGIFNGISTFVESIVRPRGMSITQAGTLGGVMLIGGIVGAVLFSPISDKLRMRKLIIVVGLVLAVPSLLGVTLGPSFGVLLASFFALGLFTTGIGPVAYQYGAEITYPAPEGTSNGLLVLAGQISVVFIYGMGLLSEWLGSFVAPLLIFAGLLALGCVLMGIVKESPMMKRAA